MNNGRSARNQRAMSVYISKLFHKKQNKQISTLLYPAIYVKTQKITKKVKRNKKKLDRQEVMGQFPLPFPSSSLRSDSCSCAWFPRDKIRRPLVSPIVWKCSRPSGKKATTCSSAPIQISYSGLMHAKSPSPERHYKQNRENASRGNP